MLMDYKVFRLANLSGPIHKQVNLSKITKELYIEVPYLAMDLYFIQSKVAKAA